MNPGGRELLRTSLLAAVPLWQAELRTLSDAELEARARACAAVVAEKGDVIQYKGKGTAEAFNRLAEGLAALSFAPGGVDFLDLHWEAER